MSKIYKHLEHLDPREYFVKGRRYLILEIRSSFVWDTSEAPVGTWLKNTKQSRIASCVHPEHKYYFYVMPHLCHAAASSACVICAHSDTLEYHKADTDYKITSVHVASPQKKKGFWIIITNGMIWSILWYTHAVMIHNRVISKNQTALFKYWLN